MKLVIPGVIFFGLVHTLPLQFQPDPNIHSFNSFLPVSGGMKQYDDFRKAFLCDPAFGGADEGFQKILCSQRKYLE